MDHRNDTEQVSVKKLKTANDGISSSFGSEMEGKANSMIEMQVGEMLQEVKTSSSKLADKWIASLTSFLKGLPAEGNISGAWLKKHDLGGMILHDVSCHIAFSAPCVVKALGSYSLQTATMPILSIDIGMEMPFDIFSEAGKDILNHVYFDKRKLFLGAVAHYLKQLVRETFGSAEDGHIMNDGINISCLRGDPRKPILVLSPAVASLHAADYEVRLIPMANPVIFKLSQLRDAKNNVRPSWWMKQLQLDKQTQTRDSSKTQSNELDASKLQPTPHYNMAIVEDLVMLQQQEILNAVVNTVCPKVARDVILLLKVWLMQKSFRFQTDAIDGHTVSILVAYLVQIGHITHAMSAMVAFQKCMKFLADTNFPQTALSFQSKDTAKNSGIFPASLTHTVTNDVSSVEYNVFWRVSLAALKSIHQEAAYCIYLLQHVKDSSASSVFHTIFLQNANAVKRGDMFVHITGNNRFLRMGEECAGYQEPGHGCVGSLTSCEYTCRRVEAVLTRALGDRVLSLIVTPQFIDETNYRLPKCSAFGHQVSKKAKWFACVGLTINHETASRRVDKDVKTTANALNDFTAMTFQDFWGNEKAQLRRFNDGSIVEAVIWGKSLPAATLSSASATSFPSEEIIEEIVRHSLSRHIVSEGSYNRVVRCVSNQLEDFLPCAQTSCGSDQQQLHSKNHENNTDNAIILTRKAVEAFDYLRSVLTSHIQDLPLGIDTLSSTSAQLRYTTVFPPKAHPLVLMHEKNQQKRPAATESEELHANVATALLKDISGKIVSKVITPISIVGLLETSSQWPTVVLNGAIPSRQNEQDAIEAFSNMKSAYLIRLMELLKTQFQIPSVVHETNTLDIFHQGFVFRLRVCPRNSAGTPLLYSTLPHPVHEHAMEAAFKRSLLIGPAHHLLIHGLHSRFSSGVYSKAVRLMSLWLSRHQFTGHISHETLELLVASVFLEPTHSASRSAPTTATAAFLQSLIRLVEHDWNHLPLYVVNNDLVASVSDDEFAMRSVKSIFKKQRDGQGGGPAMYLTAAYEKDFGYSACFSQTAFAASSTTSLMTSCPERMVLSMVQQEAKETVSLLTKWLNNHTVNDMEVLSQVILPNEIKHLQFRNCVVDCNRSVRVFPSSASSSTTLSTGGLVWQNYLMGPSFARTQMFTNLSKQEASIATLCIRDIGSSHPLIAEAVQKIRLVFGHLLLVFWDDILARDISIIFRPGAFMPQKFSILHSRYTTPVETSIGDGKSSSNGFSVVSVSTVMAEILMIGKGLLEKVKFM